MFLRIDVIASTNRELVELIIIMSVEYRQAIRLRMYRAFCTDRFYFRNDVSAAAAAAAVVSCQHAIHYGTHRTNETLLECIMRTTSFSSLTASSEGLSH